MNYEYHTKYDVFCETFSAKESLILEEVTVSSELLLHALFLLSFSIYFSAVAINLCSSSRESESVSQVIHFYNLICYFLPCYQ